MTKVINVMPTSEVIDQMAEKAECLAEDLHRIAWLMRGENDIEYATAAQSAVLSFVNNCRLDLLIVRPLRELMKD